MQLILFLMFSPRDDMHKRGLCRFAVSVCPSVCLSRSCILLKQMNVCLQNLFTVGYSHAISFSIPKVMAIFRRGPLTGVSNADGVDEARFWSGIAISAYPGYMQKSRFPTRISLHRVLSTLRPPGAHGAAGQWQVGDTYRR